MNIRVKVHAYYFFFWRRGEGGCFFFCIVRGRTKNMVFINMVLINELATVHGDMGDVTKTSKKEKKMREQKDILI